MTSLEQKEIFKNRHTEIHYFPQQQTLLLKLLSSYVPIEYFKNALQKAENLISSEQVTKMILDKSALRIFHQPSMEWYHIFWKEATYAKGLKIYRKILPDDPLFEESVKIGRAKILQENHSFNIHKFDIIYCRNLEEALFL